MKSRNTVRGLFAAAVLAATLVVGATTATAAPLQAGDTPAVGNVKVKFVMNKFVRQGSKLVAKGAVVATYTPTTGTPTTVTKPFTAVVTPGAGKSFSAASKICPVLNLVLGPLDLNLLGLMVHLDKLTLTITANSRGGLLGNLLCSLANTKLKGPALTKAARKLTTAARENGLATSGIGFGVPVGAKSAAAAAATCSILDLTLGPLHLDVLGLVVDLSTVHLVITADPAGGVLGGLLCGLVPPTPLPGTPPIPPTLP